MRGHNCVRRTSVMTTERQRPRNIITNMMERKKRKAMATQCSTEPLTTHRETLIFFFTFWSARKVAGQQIDSIDVALQGKLEKELTFDVKVSAFHNYSTKEDDVGIKEGVRHRMHKQTHLITRTSETIFCGREGTLTFFMMSLWHYSD